MTIVAEVETTVPVARAATFQQVVHIDVPRVFRGRGVIAAVSRVEDQQGDWNTVGQTRRIVLADGGYLQERITACLPPERFSYVLENLQGALRLLVSRVDGDWLYEAVTDSQTKIIWRYQFYPASLWVKPFTLLFVRLLWRPYMRQVIQAVGDELHHP